MSNTTYIIPCARIHKGIKIGNEILERSGHFPYLSGEMKKSIMEEMGRGEFIETDMEGKNKTIVASTGNMICSCCGSNTTAKVGNKAITLDRCNGKEIKKFHSSPTTTLELNSMWGDPGWKNFSISKYTINQNKYFFGFYVGNLPLSIVEDQKNGIAEIWGDRRGRVINNFGTVLMYSRRQGGHIINLNTTNYQLIIRSHLDLDFTKEPMVTIKKG